MTRFVALMVALAVPAMAAAQTLGTEDLIRTEAPQAAPVTRFMATASKSTAPENFDILLSASDRLVNKLVALGMKKQAASPSKKKLTALKLSFKEKGFLTFEGSYEMAAVAKQTKAGRFQFTVSAALDVQARHDVVFNVVEARIALNGDEVFKTTRDNPRPLGTMLDFLSPGIEEAAAEQLNDVSASLASSLGAGNVRKDLKVSDVITIVRNQITLKILPHMLSPLFPKVAIEHVAVDRGQLQIFVSFPEAK